jgi:hypothetical protein
MAGSLVNEIVNEIVERLENGKIVIISVVERKSEAFYNYQTKSLIVAWKEIVVPYEESFVRPTEIIELTTGAFQRLPIHAEREIAKELESRGFRAVLIEL